MAAPPNFRIETAQAGSGTTIKLAGELDSATCPVLVERFDQLVAAGAGDLVVLDLTEVSFIDSAGMRAIIVIERSAQEHDIPLALRPPAGPVTDLLQISGVGAHVALRPHTDDAPPAPLICRRSVTGPTGGRRASRMSCSCALRSITMIARMPAESMNETSVRSSTT